MCTDCDHVRLTKYSGVVESPNFPDPYPHNRDCTWIIETTEGNTVNLTFTSLRLEDHSNCVYDFIEVKCWSVISMTNFGNINVRDLPYAETHHNGKVQH